MRGEKKGFDDRTLFNLLQLGGRFSVHSLLEDPVIRERAEAIAWEIRGKQNRKNMLYRQIVERAALVPKVEPAFTREKNPLPPEKAISAACRSLEAEGVHEMFGWKPGYLRTIYYDFRKQNPDEADYIDKIVAGKICPL